MTSRARPAAAWAKCLGIKKVFILDDRQLYGKGIADVFEAEPASWASKLSGMTGWNPSISISVPC